MDTDATYAFMMELAHEAGAVMERLFKKGETASWKDENNTPLTEADLAINRMVIDRIHGSYPGHAIIGEEESNGLQAEYTWVCDPIDGTLYFSHHIGFSTFMLALLHKGKPVMAVVHNPFSGETISVHSGIVTHNSTQLSPLNPEHQSRWFNIEYIDAAPWEVESFRSELYRSGYILTTVLSVGALCASIAKGGIGGTLYCGSGRWDIAAIDAIVSPLGGAVTDFTGAPIDYTRPLDGALVASPGLHKELVQLTQTLITRK